MRVIFLIKVYLHKKFEIKLLFFCSITTWVYCDLSFAGQPPNAGHLLFNLLKHL